MALARDSSSPAAFALSTNANDDPVGTSASFDCPANALVRVSVMCDTGVGVTPSIDITYNGTQNLTWSTLARRGDSEGTAGIVSIEQAYVTSARTGMTVTVSVPNTGTGNTTTAKGRAWIDVWTGAKADQAGAAVGENSSTTNNITPNAVTTTANNSRVTGVAEDWNANGSPTSTDTFDAVDIAGVISALRAYKAADTATSGTVVTLNFDAAGAGAADWNWVAAEILAEAAGGGSTQTLTDTVSVNDEGLDYVFFNRLMESLLSVTDGAIRSQIFGAYFTDTLTIDEQSGQFMVRGRVAESFINVTDEALALIVGNNILTRTLSSNIDITDSEVRSIIRNRLLQDTIEVTEPGTETFTTTNLVITDEITAVDSIVTRLLFTRLLGDSIDLSDSAIASIIGQNIVTMVLSSAITTSDQAIRWMHRHREGESTVLTADQIQSVLRYTRLLEDAIDTADESLTALQRFIMLTDALSVEDSLLSLVVTPTTDNPIIRIGFDQPRIELGGYVV